eukprot:scaffold8149_cov79-Cyclotella_meneghiniana.AAC.1
MRIARDFPREPKKKTKNSPGSKGYYIAKFHGMRFQSSNNLKFGCAKTFNSDCNEKNHKFFVKENAKRTQHRQSLFSIQLSVADWNRVVIDLAYERIKQYTSQNLSPDNNASVITSLDRQSYELSDDDEEEEHVQYFNQNNNSNISRLYGCCDINIRINTHNQVTVTHKWKKHIKNKLNIHPSVHLHRTISGHASDMRLKFNMPRSAELNVETFTNATIDGHRYRANPYWKGSPWYDWACVKFPETTEARGGDKSVCRIMGFFRYKDSGSLTPYNLDVLSLHPNEINNQIDETLYAVLHCQTQYFSFHRLEYQFVRKFRMTDETKMYILPAKCLVAPVLVVPDLEDGETVSRYRFMAMLPRHKMGTYFRNHVHWYVENGVSEDESNSGSDVGDDEGNEGNELDLDGLPSDSDIGVTSSEGSDSEDYEDEDLDLNLVTGGDEELMYANNW